MSEQTDECWYVPVASHVQVTCQQWNVFSSWSAAVDWSAASLQQTTYYCQCDRQTDRQMTLGILPMSLADKLSWVNIMRDTLFIHSFYFTEHKLHKNNEK